MSKFEDEETQAKLLEAFFEKLAAFSKRESEECPHCGQQVVSMVKSGRCVYLHPCMCRLWQGDIPETWQDATDKGQKE